MRDYYEQLYVNKLDFLEEMDKILEIYNLQRLSDEEVESMNRPIADIDNKSVIKADQQRKAQAVCFTYEFYQTFKE